MTLSQKSIAGSLLEMTGTLGGQRADTGLTGQHSLPTMGRALDGNPESSATCLLSQYHLHGDAIQGRLPSLDTQT